tara:strand:- start:1134 stop:1409 length:276 start_codon:yes stop_codon:yes gene_type:complete
MSIPNGITLRHIKSVFINCLQTHKPIPLGRWNIHKDNKLNLVVNYSNEDHCGTCAEYIQIKKTEINNKNNIDEIEKNFQYEYILLSSNTQD